MSTDTTLFKDLIPVKTEKDRTLIQVPPDSDKAALFAEIKKRVADHNIINADLSKIQQAVDKASGEYEPIGPHLIQYKDEYDSLLIVKTKPLSATLMIKREYVDEDYPLTADLLAYRLKRAGVAFGIDTQALEDMAQNEVVEENVTVAHGKEPIPGRDGGIEYTVDLDKNLAPSVKDDGSVDFRDVQTIVQLNKGDVVAKQVPPTQGTPGKSVTGEEIPATPGKPYTLSPAENIAVSQDGTQLIAQERGVVVKEHDTLTLKNYLEINSDVDFSVGNINFPGKVIIDGDVKPGFSVESGDDILIHGDIEAATIKSNGGSIEAEKGVLGKNKAYLYSPKRVNISFAQNATIESGGIINVENSVLHCQCTCGTLTGESNSKVIGGRIEAEESIEIFEAGNNDNTRTELIIDSKTRRELLHKKQQLSEAEELLEKQKLPILKDLKDKKKYLTKVGPEAVSPAIKKQLIHQANTIKSIDKKSTLISQNLKMIEAELKKESNFTGSIQIKDRIHAGTVIRLYNFTHEVRNDTSNKTFRVIKGEIRSS
ncbi:MAG: DUF342 domain-containing protein [Fibrobacterota bacterium]